jgi:acid phosphatase
LLTSEPGHLNLLDRLKVSPIPVCKSLAFVKDWTYFTTPGSSDFESLIRSGRYPGTTAAWNTGSVLRSRYHNLTVPNQSTTFWSASSPRDVETAEWFARGFFGSKWNESGAAVLKVIPETAERGANTLTPGKSCSEYQFDFAYGRPCGYKALDLWQRTFTVPISTRLEPSAPGFNFSAVDIYSMFEMCGFEIMVRGVSPWCNIFTNTDWEDFEYGRDLLHYYRAGPGNKYAGAMGFLWLDATTRNILNHTAAAKSLYASFVHDGDIIPLIATLGLLDEAIDPHTHKPALLPSQHRLWDRKWRTSDIVPMGGRVVFERITCDQTLHPVQHRRFVRLLINDGHIKLGNRTGGLLGHDMTVGEFEGMVEEMRLEFGDFKSICGLQEDGPTAIDFLHQ